MRRFTLGNRYWTIRQTNPTTCEIKFGTTGGPERAVTRPIASAAAIDEMIAKQLAQGYVEVTSLDTAPQRYEVELDEPDGDALPTFAFAPNPELEAACRAAPDDAAAWAVYRDWLVSRGDMRGEYTALLAGGSTEAARALLEQHREALLGTFDEVEIMRSRQGFPLALEIAKDDPDGGNDLDEITRDVLARPLYVFVEALRFGLAGFSDANDWRPTAEAVCDSPLAPHLRELRFDDFDHEDSELSWVKFGDFSALWPRLPKLQTLVIKSGAGGKLGDVELPELRRFDRISGGLDRSELISIANAHWPKLEHLSIWTGSSGYGADTLPSDLAPLLAGDRLPVLRHLGIVNSELVDSVLDLLVGSKLLPRLHSLDLSKGILVDASFLVEHAAAFRHLRVIDVGENLLSPSEVARIHNALPHARVGEQREMYASDDDDDDARYVAVGE